MNLSVKEKKKILEPPFRICLLNSTANPAQCPLIFDTYYFSYRHCAKPWHGEWGFASCNSREIYNSYHSWNVNYFIPSSSPERIQPISVLAFSKDRSSIEATILSLSDKYCKQEEVEIFHEHYQSPPFLV